MPEGKLLIMSVIIALLLGFFSAKALTMMVLEWFGYSLSVSAMTRYVRRHTGEGDEFPSEDVCRKSFSICKVVRMVITVFASVLAAVALVTIALIWGDVMDLAIMITAAALGVSLSCFFSLCREYQCATQYVIMEGFNGNVAFVSDVFRDDNLKNRSRMAIPRGDFDKDAVPEDGELMVILSPPFGKDIYCIL